MKESIDLFKSGMYVRDIAKKLNLNPIKLGAYLRSQGFSPRKNASSKSNHPKWQGGRSICWRGYIRILKRDHPRALSNGYVWEHILVAEEKLGRPLVYFGKGDKRNETVHHINGDKQDNRPENLEVLLNKDHLLHEWSENPEKWPQSKIVRKTDPGRFNKWAASNAKGAASRKKIKS